MVTTRLLAVFSGRNWLRPALIGCVLLTFNAAGNLAAQSPPAYLSADEAGLEYSLQGEYAGWQNVLGRSKTVRSVGLQVVSLGSGKFSGTRFEGGLPGLHWNGLDRFDYEGERHGDIVRLKNENLTIEVDGEQAIIFDRTGLRVGELKKLNRESQTLGAPPPPGAVIIFDGRDSTALVNPRLTTEGLLQEGTQTANSFGDFVLHVEFLLPFKPEGRGQDRGNSGVYIQGRYELQILDSFGLVSSAGDAAAIYRIKRPDINVSLPPLAWQSYDIQFRGARFDDSGVKTENATVSLWHNGVRVHDNVSVPSKTGNGLPEGPDELPIKFQDHNNPILFRNIWLLPMGDGATPEANWLNLRSQIAPVPYRTFDPAGIPYIPF